ncbi:MAG: hypothetical protein ACP5RR_00950 [Candidatus Kapaibacteriota bacterium]|jgi:hypothetical protein
MEATLLSFFNKTNSILESFLDSFVNGFRSSNGKAYEFSVFDYQINDCKGCTEDIFFQPGGECKCEDDFNSIYPFLHKSDLLILALDLEHPRILNELTKVLLRMEPLFQIPINGANELPSKKIFSILFSRSNNQNAQIAVQLIEEFATLYNYELLGIVHRSNCHLLEYLPESISKSFGFEADFFNLAQEMCKTGKLHENLRDRIEREFLPQDSLFREIVALMGRSF